MTTRCVDDAGDAVVDAGLADVVGEVVVEAEPTGDPVAQTHQLGEHEARADGGDQGDETRSVALDQGPVGDALEEQSDQRRQHHRRHE